MRNFLIGRKRLMIEKEIERLQLEYHPGYEPGWERLWSAKGRHCDHKYRMYFDPQASIVHILEYNGRKHLKKPLHLCLYLSDLRGAMRILKEVLDEEEAHV